METLQCYRESGEDDSIRACDFWLFDDTELFGIRYDADGTWIGVAHLTDPGAALVACQQRGAALRLAQPWVTYVSERPELAQRMPTEPPGLRSGDRLR